MTQDSPNPRHPQSDLADYLQDLLQPREAPVRQWAEPPQLDARAFAPAIQGLAELQAPAQSLAVETAPDPSPPPVEPEKALAPETEEPGPVSQPAPAAAEPEVRQSRWVDGRPEWAQSGFDCLLFSVSGLKLAVPLVLLGAVHPLDQELRPLVGSPPWFMGLLRRGQRTVRVVDTARWVMPERYTEDARQAYRFVIRLDNSGWGLACDDVAQSFRLEPGDVKWRREGSRRPWLAGTVRSEMCALLDVGRFARMLAEAEQTRQLALD